MRFLSYVPVILIFSLLFVLGCTSGTSNISPVAPDSYLSQSDSQDPNLPDSTQDSAWGNPGHTLWTYQEVIIDPETREYEILPMRQPVGHWNVLNWLENGPCTDCFQIAGIAPSGTGTLLIDITVSHPFPNPKFTGFDVRGIAMFNGSESYPALGLLTSNAGLGDGELVNADAYTTLYNPTTAGSGPGGLEGYIQGKLATPTMPSSTLNGYKRHSTDDPTNTRNALFAGDTVTVTYEVDMPGGPFVMGYAVDASWATPETLPVTDPMTDFGPEANAPEPWMVMVTETPVGDGLTDVGGETVLTIDVYSLYYDEFTVTCEAPGLFNGTLATSTIVDTGVGYFSFEVLVVNSNLALGGNYRALVSAANTTNPIVPEWIDLTTYQIVPLVVTQTLFANPIAIASADPYTQDAGLPVHFFDNGSNDPDGGSITLYEWDWENDGTFDETGADVNHTFITAGTYYVQFRVTDNESATDTLDAPLEIVINEVQQDPTWDDPIGPTLGLNCSPCHINSSSGGVNLTTYADAIASGVIVAGDPDNSPLYTEIQGGSHFGSLPPADLDLLYQWILNGAPEN
jgi:PKD repeat protein